MHEQSCVGDPGPQRLTFPVPSRSSFPYPRPKFAALNCSPCISFPEQSVSKSAPPSPISWSATNTPTLMALSQARTMFSSSRAIIKVSLSPHNPGLPPVSPHKATVCCCRTIHRECPSNLVPVLPLNPQRLHITGNSGPLWAALSCLCRDIWQRLETFWVVTSGVEGHVLVSSGKKPEMMLHVQNTQGNSSIANIELSNLQVVKSGSRG